MLNVRDYLAHEKLPMNNSNDDSLITVYSIIEFVILIQILSQMQSQTRLKLGQLLLIEKQLSCLYQR